METAQNSQPVPGWRGGFSTSNPAFSYPNPDLSSLPMMDNMKNIDLLERQQAVKWPEFSWESSPGDSKSRCFQMFAPHISRIGYTNQGRVYSIICPQQGVCSPSLGCMNVEVTVTGQRGWVDETTRELAADMTVEGTIWFSPTAQENPLLKLIWSLFNKLDLEFPTSKKQGIKVTTHMLNEPTQPIFPVRTGETKLFTSPDFARHPEAWAVGNVEVQIGPIQKRNHVLIDDFNELVMDIFNMSSGNMLQVNNLLSWNVWFKAPRYVNKARWRTHAERWRDSIDANHPLPHGAGTTARYFNGDPFKPVAHLEQQEHDKIHAFLAKALLHLP